MSPQAAKQSPGITEMRSRHPQPAPQQVACDGDGAQNVHISGRRMGGSDSDGAHRPVLKTENLDLILTRQVTRTLSKNLTVQSNHVIYQIQSNRPDYALRNAKVTVCENVKGEITILYKNKPLVYTIYHKPPRQAEIVDTKTLDHHLKLPKPPAPDHPWRQYGHHLNGKPIQESLSNGTH